jgi:hypothetical protein
VVSEGRAQLFFRSKCIEVGAPRADIWGRMIAVVPEEMVVGLDGGGSGRRRCFDRQPQLHTTLGHH